jgi:hypothetical protein
MFRQIDLFYFNPLTILRMRNRVILTGYSPVLLFNPEEYRGSILLRNFDVPLDYTALLRRSHAYCWTQPSKNWHLVLYRCAAPRKICWSSDATRSTLCHTLEEVEWETFRISCATYVARDRYGHFCGKGERRKYSDFMLFCQIRIKTHIDCRTLLRFSSQMCIKVFRGRGVT